MSKVVISERTLVGLRELANLSSHEFPSLTLRGTVSLTLGKAASDFIEGKLAKRLKTVAFFTKHRKLKVNSKLSVRANERLVKSMNGGGKTRKESGDQIPRIDN